VRQYHTQFSNQTYHRRPKQSFWKRFFGAKKQTHNTRINPSRDSWTSSNPWRQPKQRNWHLVFILILLSILFLLWLGLMLFLPYFKMTKISIIGSKIISSTEMETYIMDTYLTGRKVWPSNNYFLVDTDKIYSDLQQKYLLSELKVEKIFPKELKIEMTEKNSAIIYDNGLETYLLDLEGTAISKLFNDIIPTTTIIATTTNTSTLSDTSPSATNTPMTTETVTTTVYKPDLTKFNTFDLKYLPVIYDTRLIPIEIKQTNILPVSLLSVITEWQSMIQKGGIGKVKYFEIDNLSTGIKSYLDRTWYVIFNPQNDLETQINNLKVLLRDIKPTEYVNLYYGERIFWK